MSPLLAVSHKLKGELHALKFSPPVTHVYRPLEYAWQPHEMYLDRFGNGPKKVLFMGMNPGPYGMTQTGVPFGEVAAVSQWMGITAQIEQPQYVHPKRLVEGFACTRSEVSGRRLWGLFIEKFQTPTAFFAEHFVVNYCPLVWMVQSGANLTPDKISVEEMRAVEAACQRHLVAVIELLCPSYLVGVGAYAEKRLRLAADVVGKEFVIGKILHPSPASPAANRGWGAAATKQLEEMGVW